jgi:hypothetical protein
MGTSKPSVVETKVAHRFGSNASLALEGRMVPSHERASNKGRGHWRGRLVVFITAGTELHPFHSVRCQLSRSVNRMRMARRKA